MFLADNNEEVAMSCYRAALTALLSVAGFGCGVGSQGVAGRGLESEAVSSATAGTTGLLASGLKNASGSVMCLDDSKNASTNGNPINIYPCNKADAAQKFTPYSDGTIRIHGKCVAVSGNSTVNKTRLVLETCSTSNYQKWRAGTNPEVSLNDLITPATGK